METADSDITLKLPDAAHMSRRQLRGWSFASLRMTERGKSCIVSTASLFHSHNLNAVNFVHHIGAMSFLPAVILSKAKDQPNLSHVDMARGKKVLLPHIEASCVAVFDSPSDDV